MNTCANLPIFKDSFVVGKMYGGLPNDANIKAFDAFIIISLLLGFWSILSWFIWVCSLINRHVIRGCMQAKDRLYQMYATKFPNGKYQSWAVVTGGSDGIGLAMCHNLAGQGFNIAIVSRNENKINKKLTEIKNAYPDC